MIKTRQRGRPWRGFGCVPGAVESEVAGLIGAERHERTGARTAYRHGSRTRTWYTRMGTIELAIPKVRPDTY